MIFNFLKSRIPAFKYAFDGIIEFWKEEKNTKIHTFFTVVVFALAFILKVSGTEFCILILTICSVWCAEAMNSAVERVVDLVTLEKRPLAKAAKDIAAGFVLLSACLAVVVGVLIFKDVNGYVNLWNFLCRFPWAAILAVAIGICMYFYIFMGPAEIKNKIKSKIFKHSKRRKNGR